MNSVLRVPPIMLAKRALSFSMPSLLNKVVQIDVATAQPLNKKQKTLVDSYLENYYIKDAQIGDIKYSTKPHLGPVELQIRIDGKRVEKTPNQMELICGQSLDTRYKAPAGKPKGAEQRYFSNQVSPVYDGVARKLGYKPIKGFQHP